MRRACGVRGGGAARGAAAVRADGGGGGAAVVQLVHGAEARREEVAGLPAVVCATPRRTGY